MKKLDNIKGFAVAEVLLVLLIVGAVAGVGWYVRDSQNKGDIKQSALPVANDSQKNEVAKTKKNDLGITYRVPESWSENKDKPLMGYENSITVLSSPDYQKGETPIGGDGVLQGALITVQKQKAEGTDVEKDYQNVKFGSDITKTEIGGEKAMKYFLAYEGTVYSHAIVYVESEQYDILMHYQGSDDIQRERKKYEPIFNEFLDSIKF